MPATIHIFCGCDETIANLNPADPKKVQRCRFCKEVVWPPNAALALAAKFIAESGPKTPTP